ncbi:hypothetical protein V8D89_010521 [Ganoderma adspersum]
MTCPEDRLCLPLPFPRALGVILIWLRLWAEFRDQASAPPSPFPHSYSHSYPRTSTSLPLESAVRHEDKTGKTYVPPQCPPLYFFFLVTAACLSAHEWAFLCVLLQPPLMPLLRDATSTGMHLNDKLLTLAFVRNANIPTHFFLVWRWIVVIARVGNPTNSRQFLHEIGVGFRGQAIEPSLKPLFGKTAWSLHDSLCRHGQGILDDTLALLLMVYVRP